MPCHKYIHGLSVHVERRNYNDDEILQSKKKFTEGTCVMVFILKITID